VARTQDNSQTPVSWELVCHIDEGHSWTWRRLKIDGSIELTSSPLSDFGTAVGDALKHGFRPKEQHWVVKSKNWTSHFHPGDTPISITPNGQAVTRPTEPRPAPETTERDCSSNAAQ
jgi:hypothetical protein